MTRGVVRLTDDHQQLLLAVLEQSQDCIKLLTLDGRLEFMSPNGRRVLGIDDFDAVEGHEWAQLWPEEMRETVRAGVAGAAAGENRRFEGMCPSLGGEPLWWDVRLTPIRADDRTITHLLAISRDITIRRRQRAQDQRAREAAQAEAGRSADVASEMRHRLKNLLTVVGSLTKLEARHATDAADLAERVQAKLYSLSKAQDLMRDGASTTIAADVALAEVLEASGAGELVETGTIPAVPLGLQGVQHLALILGELQTNSLKYGAMGRDAGHARLSAAASDDTLSFHWKEDSGIAVAPPTHAGSGSMLIARLGTVNGYRSAIQWNPRGPEIDFHIPIAR